ncbi:OB-fold nucleic acid binding domain-containing protein [Aeromicrobium sp. Leaf350]|uniref:OB-fold nucleic acid binding domain-containing protein n=1 Tax=Aeromicrobium sp. Leaf350 TaxID=2876565 RepID=UPI001E41BB28|nr:OB-fold nucleic acid binding domain-containing protein [Aeromicrobium sp. Leaf350]
MPGLVSRALERFSTDNRDAAELRDDAARSGCCHIVDAAPREKVVIHGVLRSVTQRCADDVTTLEAELYDGSDSVTLVWLGRRRITGVAAGRSLTARGRIGTKAGRKVLFNPVYELDA